MCIRDRYCYEFNLELSAHAKQTCKAQGAPRKKSYQTQKRGLITERGRFYSCAPINLHPKDCLSDGLVCFQVAGKATVFLDRNLQDIAIHNAI